MNHKNLITYTALLWLACVSLSAVKGLELPAQPPAPQQVPQAQPLIDDRHGPQYVHFQTPVKPQSTTTHNVQHNNQKSKSYNGRPLAASSTTKSSTISSHAAGSQYSESRGRAGRRHQVIKYSCPSQEVIHPCDCIEIDRSIDIESMQSGGGFGAGSDSLGGGFPDYLDDTNPELQSRYDATPRTLTSSSPTTTQPGSSTTSGSTATTPRPTTTRTSTSTTAPSSSPSTVDLPPQVQPTRSAATNLPIPLPLLRESNTTLIDSQEVPSNSTKENSDSHKSHSTESSTGKDIENASSTSLPTTLPQPTSKSPAESPGHAFVSKSDETLLPTVNPISSESFSHFSTQPIQMVTTSKIRLDEATTTPQPTSQRLQSSTARLEPQDVNESVTTTETISTAGSRQPLDTTTGPPQEDAQHTTTTQIPKRQNIVHFPVSHAIPQEDYDAKLMAGVVYEDDMGAGLEESKTVQMASTQRMPPPQPARERISFPSRYIPIDLSENFNHESLATSETTTSESLPEVGKMETTTEYSPKFDDQPEATTVVVNMLDEVESVESNEITSNPPLVHIDHTHPSIRQQDMETVSSVTPPQSTQTSTSATSSNPTTTELPPQPPSSVHPIQMRSGHSRTIWPFSSLGWPFTSPSDDAKEEEKEELAELTEGSGDMNPAKEELSLRDTTSGSRPLRSVGTDGSAVPPTEQDPELIETVVFCKNIQNTAVLRDALKGFRDHRINYLVLDSCRLPAFPTDIFHGIHIQWMEILNGTIQFHEPFFKCHSAHCGGGGSTSSSSVTNQRNGGSRRSP